MFKPLVMMMTDLSKSVSKLHKTLRTDSVKYDTRQRCHNTKKKDATTLGSEALSLRNEAITPENDVIETETNAVATKNYDILKR